MNADELLHTFVVFRNFNLPTDRGRPLSFRRSVTPVEIFFSSSRHTFVLTQFFQEKLSKRCELEFFTWRKILISARSFLRAKAAFSES